MSLPAARPAPAGMRPDPARGIFETLLVVGGRPVELASHLQRLERGVRTLYGGTLPPEVPGLVEAGTRDVELGRFRVTVAPDGQGHLRADARSQAVDEAVVFCSWDRAAELSLLVVDEGLGAHKWADRRLVESAEAAGGGAVPLLVGRDAAVLEASRANVFLVADGGLVTPPADGSILPGITRARVLALAAELGIRAREEPFDLDRLLEADEAFLTGAIRGVEPVRACDGRTWEEGEVTALLARALRRRWERARSGGRARGAR